jgi:methylated-DNA-[protein]-cysteine S-methyltransferase
MTVLETQTSGLNKHPKQQTIVNRGIKVMTKLWIDRIESPIGQIAIVVDEYSLCALDFANYEARMMSLLTQRYESVELVPHSNPLGFTARLQAYLAGDLTSLADIPVKMGGTAFQQQIWSKLREIPIGETWTYGQLAKSIDRPTASRAVGMANSLNPIAIVVPCHRVIGAKGTLTGYAGGLDRKSWLLQHEGWS